MGNLDQIPTLQPGAIDPDWQLNNFLKRSSSCNGRSLQEFDELIVQAETGGQLRKGREINRRNDKRRVRKGGNDLWRFRKGRHDFR